MSPLPVFSPALFVIQYSLVNIKVHGNQYNLTIFFISFMEKESSNKTRQRTTCGHKGDICFEIQNRFWDFEIQRWFYFGILKPGFINHPYNTYKPTTRLSYTINSLSLHFNIFKKSPTPSDHHNQHNNNILPPSR